MRRVWTVARNTTTVKWFQNATCPRLFNGVRVETPTCFGDKYLHLDRGTWLKPDLMTYDEARKHLCSETPYLCQVACGTDYFTGTPAFQAQNFSRLF